MKVRLIKKETGDIVFLCSSGDIASPTKELLHSLLFDFKNIDKLSWPVIGTWKDSFTPEMMLYLGDTLACVTDADQLHVYDSEPFSILLKSDFSRLISCYEYGQKYDINPEYVRVLCRQGRIPGAQKISGGWMIPETAPYPVSADRRRRDLEGLAGRPKGSVKRAKTNSVK